MLALSCVLLPSCSNDDGDTPDNGGQANVKHLILIKEKNYIVSDFSYDNQNRVTSYVVNNNGETKKYTFNYSGSIIIISVDGDTAGIYNIKNALIENADYGESEYYSFNYSSKRLSTITYQYSIDEPEIFYFDWLNNNLQQIDTADGGKRNYFEYTSIPCITPIIYYTARRDTPYCLLFNYELILYSHGYFGDSLTAYLVKCSTDKYGVCEFDYQLDSDGYVTKMTVKSNTDNYSDTDEIEYVWE